MKITQRDDDEEGWQALENAKKPVKESWDVDSDEEREKEAEATRKAEAEKKAKKAAAAAVQCPKKCICPVRHLLSSSSLDLICLFITKGESRASGARYGVC